MRRLVLNGPLRSAGGCAAVPLCRATATSTFGFGLQQPLQKAPADKPKGTTRIHSLAQQYFGLSQEERQDLRHALTVIGKRHAIQLIRQLMSTSRGTTTATAVGKGAQQLATAVARTGKSIGQKAKEPPVPRAPKSGLRRAAKTPAPIATSASVVATAVAGTGKSIGQKANKPPVPRAPKPDLRRAAPRTKVPAAVALEDLPDDFFSTKLLERMSKAKKVTRRRFRSAATTTRRRAAAAPIPAKVPAPRAAPDASLKKKMKKLKEEVQTTSAKKALPSEPKATSTPVPAKKAPFFGATSTPAPVTSSPSTASSLSLDTLPDAFFNTSRPKPVVGTGANAESVTTL